MHYNNLEGEGGASDANSLDFHRFVLFVDHEFSDGIRFVSELEVEHSLAGEGKPGEVELEQAYLDLDINKEDAISFIKQLEPHDRDYYTGFMGPLLHHGETDLFVNLRCMKITPGYISLYVGGGITLESDPADEWNETQLKALSLLKIMGTYMKIPE